MPRLTETTIDIPALDLIDPNAFTVKLPRSMEARLFNQKGLEACVILYHPAAELHVKIRLTDLKNMQHYVDQLNATVLKIAMGETPEEEGYRI